MLALALLGGLTAICFIYFEAILRFVVAFTVAYIVLSMVLSIVISIKFFYPSLGEKFRSKMSSIKDKIYAFFRVKQKKKVEIVTE